MPKHFMPNFFAHLKDDFVTFFGGSETKARRQSKAAMELLMLDIHLSLFVWLIEKEKLFVNVRNLMPRKFGISPSVMEVKFKSF
jgi:hypothetical protein